MEAIYRKIEEEIKREELEIRGWWWNHQRHTREGRDPIAVLLDLGRELKSLYLKANSIKLQEKIVRVAVVVVAELQKLRAERRARWAHYRKVDELNRTNASWGTSGRVGAPHWVNKSPDREWDRRFDED